MPKKPKKGTTLPPHFDSIDNCPVIIWNKIHENEDITWLLHQRNPLQLPNSHQLKLLKKVWENIYEEYIQYFGFSNEFKDILNKKKHIATMEINLCLGDKTKGTFIKIAKQELELMMNAQSSKKGDFWQAKVIIEKHFKFQLNPKTSVRDFYNYQKDLLKK